MIATKKFLGRIYDAKTDSWVFSDGSGTPIPNELVADMISDKTRISLNDIWPLLNGGENAKRTNSNNS